MKRKNIKFKLIWTYLKDDKGFIILYILLFLLAYIPPFLIPVFSGYALQNLVDRNFAKFFF